MRPFPISFAISAEERRALDLLKASGALATDADVIRLALWRLAEHYDLRLELAVFAIGGDAPARRRRGARRRAR